MRADACGGMAFSRAFIPTLKEVPADAQVASHVFLVRGGFIRRLAAGVYNFLPLGWRVVCRARRSAPDAGGEAVLCAPTGPDPGGAPAFYLSSGPFDPPPWIQLGLEAIASEDFADVIWEDWVAPYGRP